MNAFNIASLAMHIRAHNFDGDPWSLDPVVGESSKNRKLAKNRKKEKARRKANKKKHK